MALFTLFYFIAQKLKLIIQLNYVIQHPLQTMTSSKFRLYIFNGGKSVPLEP